MRSTARLVDLRTATPAEVEVWIAEDGAPVPMTAQAPLPPAFELAGVVSGPALFDPQHCAVACPPGRPGAELTLVWLDDPTRPLQRDDRPFVMVLQVDGRAGQRIRGIAPHATLRQIRANLDPGMTTHLELAVDYDGGALYWRYAL